MLKFKIDKTSYYTCSKESKGIQSLHISDSKINQDDSSIFELNFTNPPWIINSQDSGNGLQFNFLQDKTHRVPTFP